MGTSITTRMIGAAWRSVFRRTESRTLGRRGGWLACVGSLSIVAAVSQSAMAQLVAGYTRTGLVKGFTPQPIGSDIAPLVSLSVHGELTAVARQDGRVVVFGSAHTDSNAPESPFQRLAELARKLRDIDRVAVGGAHLVAWDRSARVTCVGLDSHGQCEVPSGLGAAHSIAAGDATSAAIDIQGALWVWGYTPLGLAHGPADLGAVIQVDAGRAYVAALQSDGVVRCWGRQGGVFEPGLPPVGDPDWPDDITKIAAGDPFILGLRATGDVVTYSWGAQQFTDFVMPVSGVVEIDANLSIAVAVLESGWVIPNVAGSHLTSPPPPLSPVLTDVHVGLGFVVGLTAGGQLDSPRWPPSQDNLTGARALPHGVGVPVDGYVTPDRGVVVLNQDGTVASWGRCFQDGCEVPEFAQEVLAISGSDSHDMALLAGGTVACWGDNVAGECDVPAGLSDVVAISAGDRLSGAVLADGSIQLWGRNDFWQLSPPGMGAAVSRLECVGERAYAVLEDGSVRVWGNTQPGQVEYVAALASVVEVREFRDPYLSPYSATVVREHDGTVRLWWPDDGEIVREMPDAAQLGNWWDLMVNANRPCVRGHDGSLVNVMTGAIIPSAWKFLHLGRNCQIAIIADDACADLDGDGFVGGAELAAVLGAWGTDGTGAGGGSSGQGVDFDGSGLVDGADLLIVLSQYGECGP